MSQTPVTLVDIIRHGEPEGGRKYRGQIDDPLSKKGWQQMRDAVADQKPWDVIVSSPLLRCAEFAKELAQRHTLPLEFEERIKEIRWGKWEGSTPEQLNQDDPLTVVRALRDPLNHRPSDAEDMHQFQQRVIDAWNEIILLFLFAFPSCGTTVESIAYHHLFPPVWQMRTDGSSPC